MEDIKQDDIILGDWSYECISDSARVGMLRQLNLLKETHAILDVQFQTSQKDTGTMYSVFFEKAAYDPVA